MHDEVASQGITMTKETMRKAEASVQLEVHTSVDSSVDSSVEVAVEEAVARSFCLAHVVVEHHR